MADFSRVDPQKVRNPNVVSEKKELPRVIVVVTHVTDVAAAVGLLTPATGLPAKTVFRAIENRGSMSISAERVNRAAALALIARLRESGTECYIYFGHEKLDYDAVRAARPLARRVREAIASFLTFLRSIDLRGSYRDWQEWQRRLCF